MWSSIFNHFVSAFSFSNKFQYFFFNNNEKKNNHFISCKLSQMLLPWAKLQFNIVERKFFLVFLSLKIDKRLTYNKTRSQIPNWSMILCDLMWFSLSTWHFSQLIQMMILNFFWFIDHSKYLSLSHLHFLWSYFNSFKSVAI